MRIAGYILPVMFPACVVLFAAAFVLGFLLVVFMSGFLVSLYFLFKCNAILILLLAACVFILSFQSA